MSLAGYAASYYAATAHTKPDCPPLRGQATADVGVIGGGYTGLSAALHLAQQGYRVRLLEAEQVGWGASGRNGGQVCCGQRLGQAELEQMLGREHARLLWEMSLEAVALVKQLVAAHRIDCDLRPGILHTAAKPGHCDGMRREVDKLQREYGYQPIRYLDRAQTGQVLATERYHGAQYWPQAAHLHPLNYALGLAGAAVAAGASLHEQSRVIGYRTDGPRAQIQTEQGQLEADYLVLACNGYLGSLEPRVAGKIMPINNFMLATEPLDAALARALIANDAAVADSRFVLNYYRLSADRRLLWGGGENYSARFPQDIKGLVRTHMLEIYPQLRDVRIDYGWGGTLAITLNRLPHFARLDQKLFVAQGYSGHGIALATLGGKLIAEAVSGCAERFDLFARVPTPSFPGGTLLRRPALVAGMLYYALRDRL